MKRLLLLLVALGIGGALGFYFASTFIDTSVVPTPQVLQLTLADQDDYIRNVSEAYAADGDLKLAQDRLARLRDPQIAARVERFAINQFAANKDEAGKNLVRLAVALGSKNGGLISLVITATPTPLPTNTRENAPVFSDVRATLAPTETPNPTAKNTTAPVYIVVENETQPYIILPTDTPTVTNTRLPNTRVPTPTETPTPTPIPPPPPVSWEPGYPGGWPPGVYFVPANVQPGEKYWHLVKAVYCDFVEENFGCPDRPGNRSGTSIYVINGGAPIDVIRSDGANVGGDPTQIGDLKGPNDPCECSWTFLVSDYRVSVAGAPSDAIGGFSLYTVGGNVLAGHAHVRYFLYFDYITR